MHAEIKIEILEDGTIKAVTEGAVPSEHHEKADQFLAFVAEKCGGERETDKLREGHHHLHEEHGEHHHF